MKPGLQVSHASRCSGEQAAPAHNAQRHNGSRAVGSRPRGDEGNGFLPAGIDESRCVRKVGAVRHCECTDNTAVARKMLTRSRGVDACGS